MRPYHQAPDCDFYVGDVLAVTASLPSQSVHTIVTSPPYWGLRDYGIGPSIWGDGSDCGHAWGDEQVRPKSNKNVGMGERMAAAGLRWSAVNNLEPEQQKALSQGSTCLDCGSWRGVLGLEPLHDCLGWARGETCSQCYICHMRTVARALWRVLRDDGTLWINIGDSYNSGTSAQRKASKDVQHGYWENGGTMGDQRVNVPGLSVKNRVGIPERLALALQADGWTWRDTIHLCKVAPMPESVRDRTTQAHEPLFLFTKKARYFFDSEGIKEDCGDNTHSRGPAYHDMAKTTEPGNGNRMNKSFEAATWGPVSKRNPRSWMLWNPEPSGLQHYAAYPRFIPSFALRAGTSEHGVCGDCGAPWERVTETTPMEIRRTDWGEKAGNRTATSGTMTKPATSTTLGWRPTCRCESSVIPATVLDPFGGSGTTSLAARQLGRRSVYIDLAEKYAAIAVKRMEEQTPMLPLPTTPTASHVQAALREEG